MEHFEPIYGQNSPSERLAGTICLRIKCHRIKHIDNLQSNLVGFLKILISHSY